MKLLLSVLLTLPLFGATLIIDSGDPTDQYFSGGNAYTIPAPAAGSTDATLRFGGTFSYQIPAADGVPYVLKLNFIEPSNAPPVRSFSVTINEELVLTKSTMPGYLVPFSRSLVAMAADGFITIRFDSVFRSATHLPAFRSGPVVSSIEVTPIFQILGTALSHNVAEPAAAGTACQDDDYATGGAPVSPVVGAPLYMCIAGALRRFRSDPEPWGNTAVSDLGGVLQMQVADLANPTIPPVFYFRTSTGEMIGPFGFQGPGPIPSGLNFPVLIQPFPRAAAQ
jgi:hypothetical protein